ncbi:S41 family peptidase [Candidatus Saccharibacteria bacterium]|nr:S41 family peptidase [Candidatus Saccharibacteria bacterium]
MKAIRYYALLALLLMIFGGKAFGQENYLWPIPEKQDGEGILYRPQDYIGVADAQTQAELNFDHLVIGAPLGTPVLCPVDGTIRSATLGYRNSWSCSSVGFAQQTGNYEQDSLIFLDWEMTQEQIHNTSLSIGVKTTDGKVVWIEGIRSTRLFKTGEPIHRGDTLGTVGYLYKKIKQPCIGIVISKDSKPVDPMTPFGLKTTFVPAKVNNKTQLTREEAQADIDGMMAALEDAFPGLYDYTPKEEFDTYIKNRMAAIGETISRSDFEVLIFKLLGKIHDSHTAIISEPKVTDASGLPSSVCLGWFNDTLQVWRTVPRYKDYLGKPVVSVNGISADSLKTMVLEYVAFSDGYVKSYGDYVLLYGMDNYYCDQIAKDANLIVTFADGETRRFEQMTRKDPNREPQWMEYQYRHYHVDEKGNEEKHFEFENRSDTVAYLALHTFELDDLEMEQINEIFADLIADSISNLILDLRFNYGGPEASVEGIYAHLAQKPFCTSLRKIVNKKGGYQCFGSCPVDADQEDVYPDYEPLPNGEGFVKDEPEWKSPDSLVNYKGRLYLLTNETSFSASTCFAGWVKKQNRGVIVGRETGSAYHQMKAENFKQYLLPNSDIAIQIPTIKVVFDTVVNERFPYGRGVLPDYPVNFTPEELSFAHGDSILNYTLQLIRDGKYIYYVEPEPETLTVEEEKPSNWWIWVLVGVAMVALSIGVVFLKRKA